MQRALGIDLGTTNSVMAYMTRGEPKVVRNSRHEELTPSVVRLDSSGALIVGGSRHMVGAGLIWSVKRFMGRKWSDAKVQTAIKRLGLERMVSEGADGSVRVRLGNRDFSPTEISALILRRMKEDAEAAEGVPFSRAVISVPAYFLESQVAATHEAGRMAGFHVLRIVHEPTAAALSYGLATSGSTEPKTILVYDLGGGTFDVSILASSAGYFSVLGIAGDLMLGGDNFDQLIKDHVNRQARAQSGRDLLADGPHRAKVEANLRQEAEKAKINLSTEMTAVIDLPFIGPDGDSIYCEISLAEYEAMIAPYVDQSIEITAKAIRDAGLSKSDIDAVLLVGGPTATPLVRRRISEFFGADKVRANVNPMLCVAMGAAIQSSIIREIVCPSCQRNNPIETDACANCGNSLAGTDAPITKLENVRVIAPTIARVGNAQPVVLGPSGQRCPKCGFVNQPGARACAECRESLGILDTIDITPHPIGIELQDGRHAIVMDRGTPFPNSGVAKRFFTASAGQPRLEVNVYEGDMPRAIENELIGLVTIPLAETYARGTPIDIKVGLDTNRNVDVYVQIDPPYGASRRELLRRAVLKPELKSRLLMARQKLADFVDHWQAELTGEELRAINEQMEIADNTMSGISAAGSFADAERVIENTEKLLADAIEIRGTSAVGSQYISRGHGLMSDDQIAAFQALYDRLDRSRERADWTTGMRIVKEFDEAIGKFNRIWPLITAESSANDQRISPALRSRLAGASASIRAALQKHDEEGFERGYGALGAVWGDLQKEYERLGQPVPSLTKPQDRA